MTSLNRLAFTALAASFVSVKREGNRNHKKKKTLLVAIFIINFLDYIYDLKSSKNENYAVVFIQVEDDSMLILH